MVNVLWLFSSVDAEDLIFSFDLGLRILKSFGGDGSEIRQFLKQVKAQNVMAFLLDRPL